MLLHVFTQVMLGELQSDIYSQTCEDTWDVVAQPFV